MPKRKIIRKLLGDSLLAPDKIHDPAEALRLARKAHAMPSHPMPEFEATAPPPHPDILRAIRTNGGMARNSKARHVVWYSEGNKRGRPLVDPPEWEPDPMIPATSTKAHNLKLVVKIRASELSKGGAMTGLALKRALKDWLYKEFKKDLSIRRIEQILKAPI